MKVLFCAVTNEDIYGDHSLDLCVVPLSDSVCAKIQGLTKAVVEFAAEFPDFSVIVFEDGTPRFYDTDWDQKYLDQVECEQRTETVARGGVEPWRSGVGWFL